MDKMKNVVLLIPVYNPSDVLLHLIEEFLRMGFQDIVLVNDGSDPCHDFLFHHLKEKCVVLVHAVNLGKGRALKTGFNFIYLNYPSADGVVTVDADGQHHPEDVKNVAETLMNTEERAIIIGQREFTGSIPFRSLIGNVITKYIFYFLVGRKLSDTQSGLRGLPKSLLPELIQLDGERYDYEMNILIQSRPKSIDIIEVNIKTIYFDHNISSHFDPFFDSMKIYFLFLRFISSSLFASGVDLIIYSFLIINHVNLALSIFVARIISSFLNFIINKSYVFKKKNRFYLHLIGYYSLVVFIALMSYILIKTLNTYLGMNLIIAKIVSETFLFMLSFVVQRDFVFSPSKE